MEEFKTFSQTYIPENQGKNFRLICPNCKKDKMNGEAIFLYCINCNWVGQIQEVLFTEIIKEEEN